MIAALATPAVFYGGLLAVYLIRGESIGELGFRGLGFLILFVLPLSLGAACFVGLPLVLLLRSQNLLTPRYVIFGAALLGATALSVLTIAVMREALTFGAIAVGVGVGVVAGVVFCLAAGIAFHHHATEAAR
ncbi:MAG: hypothetical protein H7Y89_00135 [Steroidobacteraceae bacterium]|nr:hypothetical protein [Steroidobacteraceae bacterium]